MTKSSILACLGLILSQGWTLANDRFGSVRESIAAQLTESGVPSVAVAVAKDGKIIWEQGFGWADREKRVAATEHTLYSLASISKPITATALMTLVAAGKIDLDRPINDYLGDAKLKAWTGNAQDATVRRVANHSSGLPLHYQFFYGDEPYEKPSMDETILRYGNLVMPPGERHVYSNLGYGILGYVIERVSGERLADYLRQAVFVKLGLTHTSLNLDPRLADAQAIRYASDGSVIPFYDFDHPGASAVYASAHDLVRFGMFHLKDRLPDQSRILSDSQIDEMHRPTIETGPHSGYGIGWRSEDRPDGYHVLSHGGHMDGVTTMLRLVPGEDLAVVVLSNSGEDLAIRLSGQIMQALLPHWKPEAQASQASGQTWPPRELIGKWTGKLHTYKTDMPFELTIFESGDVHAQLGSQLPALVSRVRWEEGWFHGSMMSDIHTEDAARRPYSIELSLKLRGKVLNGGASAIALPAKRAGFALTNWVELIKN